MAVLNQQNRDSFETAFEQGVSQAKKQVVKVADDVKQDIVTSVLGVRPTPQEHEEVKQKTVVEDKQKVAEARAEVKELEEKMKKIREERESSYAKKASADAKAKADKSEEKKKKESVFAQMLKAKKGTHEALKGVSG